MMETNRARTAILIFGLSPTACAASLCKYAENPKSRNVIKIFEAAKIAVIDMQQRKQFYQLEN